MIVGVLCFSALTVDRTFSKLQLTRWVYCAICWDFVAWTGLLTLTSFRGVLKLARGGVLYWDMPFWMVVIMWSEHKSHPMALAAMCSMILIPAGFAASALSRFNVRVFQVLFPLVAVVLFFWLSQTYAVLHGGRIGAVIFRWDTPPFESFRMAFEQSSWNLFFLVVYFYLNAQYHEHILRNSAFVRKLPKVGVILVLVGFLREFPEFGRLRDAFPLVAGAFEISTMVLDILLLLILTLLAATRGHLEDAAR